MHMYKVINYRSVKKEKTSTSTCYCMVYGKYSRVSLDRCPIPIRCWKSGPPCHCLQTRAPRLDSGKREEKEHHDTFVIKH